MQQYNTVPSGYKTIKITEQLEPFLSKSIFKERKKIKLEIKIRHISYSDSPYLRCSKRYVTGTNKREYTTYQFPSD